MTETQRRVPRFGESAIAFFASPAFSSQLKRRFPKSLGQAPMLLVTTKSPLRRGLEEWFAAGCAFHHHR